jgi:ribose 5-phosphate isomerase B
MKVYLGADHRGYNLKEIVKKWLYMEGHDVVDCGNTIYDQKDDFPDFTFSVSDNVVLDNNTRGIVICGSGGGVTIAANKVHGIRCAQALNVDDVVHNRAHDDINVLAIGSDFTKEMEAKSMISAFIATDFLNEDRLVRRLKKISHREK